MSELNPDPDYRDVAYATQPAPEEETFTCWRCEEQAPIEEQTLFGTEYVCEGCSEDTT